MANETVRLAAKELETRRQNAIFEAEAKRIELCERIPRIREIDLQLSQTAYLLSKIIFSKSPDLPEQIRQITEDNLKLQNEFASLLTQNGYPAEYLERRYTCKECEDSGFVEGKRCGCFQDLITKYTVSSFQSNHPFEGYTFGGFSLRYYPAGIKGHMADILRFCQQYAHTFHKHSPSVLMLGNTGLGKTHLSLSIAKEITEHGFSVLYVSAPDFFRKLQSEYYGRGEAGADTLDTAFKADLVILDDLGSELENQFNTSTLYHLVNSRLNSSRPIIINTNLTLKEIEARYTDRVASRLMTLYRCLKFTGQDIRQIQLKEKQQFN